MHKLVYFEELIKLVFNELSLDFVEALGYLRQIYGDLSCYFEKGYKNIEILGSDN